MTLVWWWVLRIWAMINVIGIAFFMGKGECGKDSASDEDRVD